MYVITLFIVLLSYQVDILQIICLVFVCCYIRNVAERTSRQLDPILMVTKSTTVIVACAKIVNVTGPCRRRRGYWKEDPIVLTFDEETEKLTDILFTPVYR